MDDRQTKIREGAGLEDSRINQEFVDFLNKWSSPVLIVLAVAALIWAGLTKLEQMKNEKIDNAFGEFQAAIEGGNPAPTSLTTMQKSPTFKKGKSAQSCKACCFAKRSAIEDVNPYAQ